MYMYKNLSRVFSQSFKYCQLKKEENKGAFKLWILDFKNPK